MIIVKLGDTLPWLRGTHLREVLSPHCRGWKDKDHPELMTFEGGNRPVPDCRHGPATQPAACDHQSEALSHARLILYAAGEAGKMTRWTR